MSPFTSLCLVAMMFGQIYSLTDAEIAKFSSKATTEANTNVQGSVSLTKNGDTLTLVSNNIPDHETGTFPSNDNPNTIAAQSYSYTITNDPAHASSTTCLPEGPIGFTLNGVAFYSPMTGFGTNAGHCEVFDSCDAHPSPDGAYHYHRTIGCQSNTTISDQLLGVALDGFPLYGPRLPNGTLITQSTLDDCHGATIDGSYRYYLTETYPYMLGCFKGTPVDNKITQGQTSNRCMFASALSDTTDCTTQTGNGPPPGCPPGQKCGASSLTRFSVFALLMIGSIIGFLLF